VIIQRLEVRNFRALSAAAVDLGGVNYLVGRNGAGKSTLLNALAVFFKQASATGPEEFTLGNTVSPIEISVTFRDLGPTASNEFERYVREGRLRVTKRVAWENGRLTDSYHGTSLAFRGFRSTRMLVGAQRITAYRDVQSDFGLPAVRSVADVDAALEAWEENHRDRPELIEDDGQFFGYSNVGTGKLNKYIDFVLVPAVRDAADDASESKDSALRHLVDVVVRRTADLAAPMSELRQTIATGYAQLIERPDLSLEPLSQRINRAFQNYAPGATVIVRWSPPTEPRLPDLSATARLVDDGVEGDVATKGHGLQRAYIMASLQALAEVEMAQAPQGDMVEGARCGLMLAVEEPELYQHPAQARQIARTFRDLVAAAGSQVQVVACTHSPIFLDVRTFDDIRVVRKRPVAGGAPENNGEPRHT
jgi:energy-coupling factor transporter ATP-binding protein EcfA2